MDREAQLDFIQQGSAQDRAHIQHCLYLVDNEPDDLVRIYARLWLEHHSLDFARALVLK
jgi:hypothetical protein